LFLEKVETAEDAADAWAALDYIEQKSQWWKVELLSHVRKGRGGRGVEGGASEFVRILKEKHDIELSGRYGRDLRRLGDEVEKLGVHTPGLAKRIKELPITTATKIIRANDLEGAVEVAESGTQRDVDQFLRVERLDESEFKAKIFDIWSFGFRDPRYGSEGYEWGLICGQIVENLLHFYTEEGDTVLDPMAGGGTTIDVCRAFGRECLAFDIKPARDDIEQNDITEGLPEHVQDVQLVILEPPYFNMMKNAFGSYNEFLKFLTKAVNNSAKRLKSGGYLALIVMDQVNKEQQKFPIIGPSYRILEDAGLDYEHLVGLPLATEQFTAYHVDHAKKGRFMLGINRQMWVFRRTPT
jgi:hypothetical protein